MRAEKAVALAGLALAALVWLSAEVCGAVELDQEFHLAAAVTTDTHYFVLENVVTHHALNGTRTGKDLFRLALKCEPGGPAEPDVYTCLKFEVQPAGGALVTIPGLEGWSYKFDKDVERGSRDVVLGIPHEPFEGLTDSTGAPLQPTVAYPVYNSFIDFHALVYIFGRPDAGEEGQDIGDLRHIGDRIVHTAAGSEAATNLGTNILEGSHYTNGEVTLELKGLSLVDGRPCAIIAYDSGEGSFKMIIEPAPGTHVEAVGSSHYHGDLYVDLETGWVRKADLSEPVMTEAKVTGPVEVTVNEMIERALLIREVDAEGAAEL